MRRSLHMTMIFCTLVLITAARPVQAQGNWQPGDFGSLRFRIGLFEPRADSEYWDEIFTTFTGSKGDFQDISFGIDYLWRMSMRSGLQFGASFYGGSSTQAYRDWVDADGRDIRHNTSLDTWDMTVAYTYRFGARDWKVRPYGGLGLGLLNYRLQENGSFIDFGQSSLPIVNADYRDSGWTWEGFGLAGLEIPLGFKWSFFGEGRYRWSETELGGDFSGAGTLDLSGFEFSLGFSWNF